MPVTLSGGQFVEETHERTWVIPKWLEVSQREDLLKEHDFNIETYGDESRIETRWQVGWKLVPHVLRGSGEKSCEVHWTMTDVKGMTGNSLTATITTSVMRNYMDGSPIVNYQCQEQQGNFRLMEPVSKLFHWISEDVLKPDGDLVVRLNLTLVLPRFGAVPDLIHDNAEAQNVEVEKVEYVEAEKVEYVKTERVQNIKAEKLEESEASSTALRWHNEWHETEATSNQAKVSASCSGNGRENDKNPEKKKEQSKRKDKSDSLENPGLKKIKLEVDPDNCPSVKEEEEEESDQEESQE